MGFTLSGTIGRASHSLISHTKGARNTREVEGQQRLAALAHEHSCTLAVGQVQVLLHQACLDRVANDTMYSTFSTLIQFAACMEGGEATGGRVI